MAIGYLGLGGVIGISYYGHLAALQLVVTPAP